MTIGSGWIGGCMGEIPFRGLRLQETIEGGRIGENNSISGVEVVMVKNSCRGLTLIFTGGYLLLMAARIVIF